MYYPRIIANSCARFVAVMFLYCALLLNSESAYTQEIPIGYEVYFRHSAAKPDLFEHLLAEDSASWMIVAEKPQNVLRIAPQHDSRGKFPQSRAMFANWIWGDYILTFDFRFVLKAGSDSSAFVFLTAARDPENYYAFAFGTDSLSFYYVDEGKAGLVGKRPFHLKSNAWNKLTVRRDILTRSFTFALEGSSSTAAFSHRDLVMGSIGLGSHLGTTYVRNFVLWAPTVIDDNRFEWHAVEK